MLLFNASKALASTVDLDQLLNIVVSEVQAVLGCEGAGVLLYDPEKDDFYWRIVQDRERFLSSAQKKIRIPKDKGVCGWVFETGEPALVHDAANDPRLYREVESKSGFTTRNMICVPLQSREKRLGVLYALNKSGGSFTGEDVEVVVALSGSVALALENAAYYERLVSSHKELERLNLVKNKILNHLSHELNTPLSIIEATLRIIHKKLLAAGVDVASLPFERMSRNLDRLKTIEKQVSHIVGEKELTEPGIVLGFLDWVNDLIEIQVEEEPQLAKALEALRGKIEAQLPVEVAQPDRVAVEAAFQAAELRVSQMLQNRVLDIRFHPPDPVIIRIGPHIVMSIIEGLVRNAIENTPDHGKIEITGRKSESRYLITIRDYGVGIPESEQRNIFEGFCPVQETDMYSSRHRYAFNAGGTGTDLLKTRIFSERFGFEVRLQSSRCTCIPSVRDLCPGDITKCLYCHEIEDCLRNGGTELVLEIPPDRLETMPEAPEART